MRHYRSGDAERSKSRGGRARQARSTRQRATTVALHNSPRDYLSPTLGQARLRQRAGAAICVQDVDVQCVLQFTLIHAASCALHRRTSRVIHRIELCLRACAFLRALALDLYRSLAASATLATRLRSVLDPWGVRTRRLAVQLPTTTISAIIIVLVCLRGKGLQRSEDGLFVRGRPCRCPADYSNHFPHRGAAFNPGFAHLSPQDRRVRQSSGFERRTPVQVSENPTSDLAWMSLPTYDARAPIARPGQGTSSLMTYTHRRQRGFPTAASRVSVPRRGWHGGHKIRLGCVCVSARSHPTRECES